MCLHSLIFFFFFRNEVYSVFEEVMHGGHTSAADLKTGITCDSTVACAEESGVHNGIMTSTAIRSKYML